ncbi:MAG: allantoicase [Pseudomonadota bacterium]
MQWIDLAQPRLGSSVVFATDDFFADKARLIAPQEPVWREGEYDANGKWMDGWESRRKRTEGHDYAIIKLGVPGVLRGFDIDTRFFTGNYPPEAAIDGCVCAETIPPPDTVWDSIVDRIGLVGDSHHYVAADADNNDIEYTHVRLHIYPDGGVARLRVYGEIRPDWSQIGNSELIDLAALTNGGKALICNDEHFGSMRNLNAPGNAVNMGDGWETARRREPGNDWVILALGHPGFIRTIHIDTSHFKGNFPDHVVIQAVRTTASYPPDLAIQSIDWPQLLPSVKLSADRLHEFVSEVDDIGPVSHIRINIFPDGGLARVRLFGVLARDSSDS